ncbi:MAG: cysteine desulfurase [Chlorobi bacterium OLB7]|nr:MAG: cysteine desulfurase [Chlorobi bacterium OLB7]
MNNNDPRTHARHRSSMPSPISIYLDNHATTPVDPRVLAAMLPWFTEQFGNAASTTHPYGWRAEIAVKQSRELIAEAIGAQPMEVVFTSGATESDNLAIKGVAEAYASIGDHIITAATEHNAVLDTCRYLEQRGVAVTYLPVDAEGRINLDELQAAFTQRTVLVSIMHGNNETGVIQPIQEIGAACRQRRVLFHTDATQTLGKIPFDVNELNVDLASFSAHKMYGPKGCGALFVRRKGPRVQIAPQLHGGGHEQGSRSGTLNVPGIVGFGEAVRIAAAGAGNRASRNASPARPSAGASLQPNRRASGERSGPAHQPRAAPSREPQSLLPRNRSRCVDWRGAGCGVLHRIGLQFGQSPTKPRPAGNGANAGPAAVIGAVWGWAVQHQAADSSGRADFDASRWGFAHCLTHSFRLSCQRYGSKNVPHRVASAFPTISGK